MVGTCKAAVEEFVACPARNAKVSLLFPLLTMTLASQTVEVPDIYPPIFNYGSGHWRCDHCVESLLYSLANGYPEHVRMWTCCQCGFNENRESLWASCSNCYFISSAERYAFQDASLDESAIVEGPHHDDGLEISNTIRVTAPATSLLSLAADDLVSTVQQNFFRFEEFETSGQYGTLLLDD